MNEEKGTAIDRWEKRQPETQVLAPVPSTADIMMQAVRNGLGKEQLEVLERMFELDIRSKERQAKEAYYKAMAWWSSDAPVIIKDKEVSYKAGGGTTAYKHAGLGNVTQAINTSMSQYGLHASWTTTQPEGKITVKCVVTHELGHSESTSLTADADTSGSKNPIQAIGSTVSYLSRYTILALTGLATHEQDTDGVPPGERQIEFIDKDQQKIIQKKLKTIYGDDPSMFFSWLGCETIDTIQKDQFKKILNGLTKAEAKKAAETEREPGCDDE